VVRSSGDEFENSFVKKNGESEAMGPQPSHKGHNVEVLFLVSSYSSQTFFIVIKPLWSIAAAQRP